MPRGAVYPPDMRYTRLLLLPLVLLLLGLRPTATALPVDAFTHRYILVFANLNDPAQVDQTLAVLARGAAAGYNGVLLGDSNGEYIDLDTASDAYLLNVTRVRVRAVALGLALIPYSYNPRQVTYRDPSLAEALPVRGTPFRVTGATAQVEGDPATALHNARFAAGADGAPAGWSVDGPGIIARVDGNALCLQDPGVGDPQHGTGRAIQQVPVMPYRAYELSARVKTAALSDPDTVKFYVAGVDGAPETLYQNRFLALGAPVAATQEWTRYTVRFNSLGNHAVRVYLGIWSRAGHGVRGRAWFTDVALREVGLEGTVRRASLPVTVTSFDGKTTYREGDDYRVAEGRLTLPAGSAIPAGARLAVSWYLRADMLETTPPANAGLARYDVVQRELATRVDTLFGHPDAFMINYDEWRVGNWDPSTGYANGGAYLADALTRATRVLHGINPRYELFVWNDMYDPHANAVPQYCLMHGDLSGAWEGIPPETVVVTWTGGAASLQFFADRGVPQLIAGYYDDPDNVAGWQAALKEAEGHGARGVRGFVYTTWAHDYSRLEAVAAQWKAAGRWGE